MMQSVVQSAADLLGNSTIRAKVPCTMYERAKKGGIACTLFLAFNDFTKFLRT